MKIYKFPQHINSVDGSEIKDAIGKPVNFHVFLSNSLCNTNDSETGIHCVKAVDWAREIYKTGEIEIDETDRSLLENWIKSLAGFSAIVKIELLKVINENLNN